MTLDTTNLEAAGVPQKVEDAPVAAATPKPEGAARVLAFSINIETGEVLGHRTRRDAVSFALLDANKEKVIDVVSEKDLRKVPGPVLVKVWNFAIAQAPAGESRPKEITRFSDQEVAARRVWPVVEYLGENRRAPNVSSTSTEDTTVATKTKKTKGKKTTAKKATGERKPRTTGLGSMIITKLGKYETGRAESQRTKNWSLIRDGMRVSDFLAKGGSHIDLRAYELAKVIKLTKGASE